MFQRFHEIVLFSPLLLCGDSILFQSNYGIKTGKFPKDSCHEIVKIENKGKCMLSCLAALDVHYMFSYNEEQEACLCCKDLSGSDVISIGWETFIPRLCKEEYVTYNYTDFQICVKYVSDLTTYPEAVKHCRADGGDLFRIDTALKYDIFKDLLAPFTSSGAIQVWVQAVKVDQVWRFHDGSPVPEFCPMYMSNSSLEIHLRARSPGFGCLDYSEAGPFSYVCEYNRQFPNMPVFGAPNIYVPTSR
ncbi:uncharacterized protein LOC111116676 [Crassostrea virginica]